MNMKSLYYLIKGRRSVRAYKRKSVPISILKRILNAARWAPSAHNAQPWRFIIIEDEDSKYMLAKTMAHAWLKDLMSDGIPENRAYEIIRKEAIERFTKSPVLILVCLTMKDMDMYSDERRNNAERTMAIQSVAAAIQNLLLAAHYEGLGACWVCAPLFCSKEVSRALSLPEDFEPQAIITLGYPAEKPTAPPRKPLNEIVWVYSLSEGLKKWVV